MVVEAVGIVDMVGAVAAAAARGGGMWKMRFWKHYPAKSVEVASSLLASHMH